MKTARNLILRLTVLVMVLVSVTAFGLGERAQWDCPGCGKTGNTGNFCGNCGQPAPAGREEAETDYTGTWNCTEFVSNGKHLTAKEYNAEMTLTLREDGTGNLILTIKGETKNAHITWKATESGIETTDITGKVVPFPLVDGKLQWQTDGGVLCIFEK